VHLHAGQLVVARLEKVVPEPRWQPMTLGHVLGALHGRGHARPVHVDAQRAAQRVGLRQLALGQEGGLIGARASEARGHGAWRWMVWASVPERRWATFRCVARRLAPSPCFSPSSERGERRGGVSRILLAAPSLKWCGVTRACASTPPELSRVDIAAA
jgi:hypothetical protein